MNLLQKGFVNLVRLFISILWFFDKTFAFSFYTIFLVAFFGTATILVSYNSAYIHDFAESLLEFKVGGFSDLSSSEVAVTNPTDMPSMFGQSFKTVFDKEFFEKNKDLLPRVSAEAVLVVDKKNNHILYDLNGDKKFASASTTKLMTALVALDITTMDEVLTVPSFCTEVEGTKVGLPAGEKFKVKDLMYSLLVYSAADSACVLSNSKIPYSDFIWLMNKKASRIGMQDTFFTNPIGLDSINGSHYSTASDLYKLEVFAMQNQILRSMVGTKEYTISSVDGSFTKKVFSTNRMLSEVSGSIGVKTGTTAAAGEVLIYEYLKDDKNFVIIIMGSKDRFSDTKLLLDWVLRV